MSCLVLKCTTTHVDQRTTQTVTVAKEQVKDAAQDATPPAAPPERADTGAGGAKGAWEEFWLNQERERQARWNDKGNGGAPPSNKGTGPLKALPVVGIIWAVPSDTSIAPADVWGAAGAIGGLKVLPSVQSLPKPIAVAGAAQFTVDADALAKAAPGVKDLPGYFTVVTHADAKTAFVLRNGEWISIEHRTLARFIEGAGWQGEKIFLVGCNAGACATGLAQNLANKLGVEVLAPQGEALLLTNGTVASSVGDWVTFVPGVH